MPRRSEWHPMSAAFGKTLQSGDLYARLTLDTLDRACQSHIRLFDAPGSVWQIAYAVSERSHRNCRIRRVK